MHHTCLMRSSSLNYCSSHAPINCWDMPLPKNIPCWCHFMGECARAEMRDRLTVNLVVTLIQSMYSGQWIFPFVFWIFQPLWFHNDESAFHVR
jgi:hypothetical protein